MIFSLVVSSADSNHHSQKRPIEPRQSKEPVMQKLPTFNEETLEWDPAPIDYLPDSGVFNDSGHGLAHLGYLFGISDGSEGGRFVRPAFLQRATGLPKYVEIPCHEEAWDG